MPSKKEQKISANCDEINCNRKLSHCAGTTIKSYARRFIDVKTALDRRLNLYKYYKKQSEKIGNF